MVRSSLQQPFVVSVVVGVVWVIASSRVVECIVVTAQLVSRGRAILSALPSFPFSISSVGSTGSHNGGSSAASGIGAAAS